MSTPVIQTSFNAGEWAPALNARVDLAKYHSGAALLLNFFVDYRGGATTRPGTKYVLQCYKPATTVRLIPFQASFTVSYILEFGNNYIRFFTNGAPVLETATVISGVTNANPGVITGVAHGYVNGDWVYISNVGGTTQLNGNYYIIAGATTNTYTLTDLQGNVVNATAFGVYTSGGQAQRIYTLASPYLSTELAQIKYSQNVNQLVLCHPNYASYILTLNNFNSWTIVPITFGSSISAPTGLSGTSTLSAGNVNYAYVVTTVDGNGQESAPTVFITLANLTDIRSVAGSNTIQWTAVAGAQSYNVYRAEPRYSTPVASGSQFGFVGNLQGTLFTDSNISPDFSQGPPIILNPFAGTGVASITLTASGSGYTSVPGIILTPAPGGGTTATAFAYLTCINVTINTPGTSFVVGDNITIAGGVVLLVTGTGAFGAITSISIITHSLITGGATPFTPSGILATSGFGSGATFNMNWGVASVQLANPGTGYIVAPSVGFSGGAGGGSSATTTLGAPSAGNPTVPGFFDQRLILAGPVGNPQQFNMSQPGSYFNFNVNNPIEPDDAIQASLVSGRLNSIKSMVTMPAGLIMFSDQQAWLVNGGSPGAPVSATSLAANSQAYNGASDLPPIIANANILYVQSKSSIVRDLAYNFYTNVYAGTNISTLSSHLFFGFTLSEWCWAEEPFKLVWAVRNDGDLLSCTYQKEQEMVAWAHHDTLGAFKSIASVTEIPISGPTDAVYHVVQRVVNGQSTQYIERFVELIYPQGFKSSWFVDAGITYSGTPVTVFSGAQHLGGQTVTGVADGKVIPPFVMAANGQFTLAVAASIVTVGIPILAQVQTLSLDLGEPTVQGKRKKISAVTVRGYNTLGLSIGRTFDASSQKSMKDFAIGNVGTMTNQLVTDLVTGDGRTIIDPLWDVPGQYCIQQSQPYPASILGVIPEIEVGDDA